jgi:ADP-heptose:LPS heptosyltransferase
MFRKTIRITDTVGIGDNILLTIVLKALRKKFPGHRLIMYVRKRKHLLEVYKNNPGIDKVVYIKSDFLWSFYYSKKVTYRPAAMESKLSIDYSRSVATVVAEKLDVKLDDLHPEIYLTKAESAWGKKEISRYRSPVIVQLGSTSSDNKAWPIEKWKELMHSLPEIDFVQLGSPGEFPLEGAVNLLGKTSLRQAFSMLQHASGFVGIDSGLQHAAAALSIPGVVLWGTSNPKTWGHETHINISKGLSCSPCMDILCNNPCPYNIECMNQISVDEVRTALLKQMSRNNGKKDLQTEKKAIRV